MNDDEDRPADERSRPGEPGDPIDRLLRDGETNALLAWATVGLLGAVVLGSLAAGDPGWTAFAAAVCAVLLVPPVAFRDPRAMLPWELLALALAPVAVRAAVGGPVGTFAAYLAVAGVALLVTVELDLFTELEVTHWFAVASVVATTMASVAVWTVVRWSLDRLAGTAYLTTNDALMREWFAVLLAGLAAGVLFDGYFRWRDRRLREGIRAAVER